MAVVTASNLRKEIAGSLLFEGVSFSVERRDRLALSGPNGAGKTTLLRMLTGESERHGAARFAKWQRIALHYQPASSRGMSLREYALSDAPNLVATSRSCMPSSRQWTHSTTARNAPPYSDPRRPLALRCSPGAKCGRPPRSPLGFAGAMDPGLDTFPAASDPRRSLGPSPAIPTSSLTNRLSPRRREPRVALAELQSIDAA